MATIDDKIKAIQDKLKQAKARKQKMDASKKAAETKALRARDTRKKILLGAFMLDRMEKNQDYAAKLMPSLNEFFKRDDDRAIFGLEPLQKQAPTPAAAPAPAASSQTHGLKPLISDTDMLLKTEFTDRDDVKNLGAKWNAEHKKWYVPAGMDNRPFMKWIQV